MSSPVGDQKVVRLYPPSYDIRVETTDIPKIEHPDDAIVKIKLAGLCGSDLHTYRGTEAVTQPFICGHEFVGHVVALGASFHAGASGRPLLYSTLQIGDKVVSPFTVSCGECHFCRIGFTSRCEGSRLFGTATTAGGQAQYVRVPRAGGTLYRLSDIGSDTCGAGEINKETIANLADSSLLLLCDILPTGVFAAFQALNHPKLLPITSALSYPYSSGPANIASQEFYLTPQDTTLTIAVIGLGPVGLCATVSLIDMLESRGLIYRIVAVDPTDSRRNKMAVIYSKLSDKQDQFAVASIEEAKDIVKTWTDGVGCNAVLEVVGNNSALALSYELVRPFGCISSVGVHGEPHVPFRGRELYDKNVSMEFGRCPVRAMFPMALGILLRRQDVFGAVGGEISLVEKIVSIDDAKEYYDLFHTGKCGKILFDPWM
ncbi:chaperonin 10-like protein [Hygrophoropsis aurantiaca]|uniref:Chaperonin 10-like protein n=1 Tax=Hygrophoropsis aurantiaca TaxID=72124 RepID=A0ACB8AJ10_9AGAM|nr:chaperonin 10-like protein [Hygrophoropsis aurantiaca]